MENRNRRDMESFSTLGEISLRLAISVLVLMREITKGKLVAHGIGGCIYVSKENLQKYLDSIYLSGFKIADNKRWSGIIGNKPLEP